MQTNVDDTRALLDHLRAATEAGAKPATFVFTSSLAVSSMRRYRCGPSHRVRGDDDDRISVNPISFDVGPLMEAIAAQGSRGHTGERWS